MTSKALHLFLTPVIILLGQVLVAQDVTDREINFIKNNTISFDKNVSDVSIDDFKKINLNPEIKVFGLGEANHGTKEFQILKLKLAQYLIHEKGLNTIIIEFPYPQGLLLDQYVKGENSDGIKILTDQKNSEYKNTDFIDFINSIRELNLTRNGSNKISFIGGDIFGKPTAIKLLKRYFDKVDPSKLEIFSSYLELASNTYMSVLKQDEKTFDVLSKKVNKLLKVNKTDYILKSSPSEYRQAVRLAESLKLKWKGNQRANSFAKNVLITLNENPNNKVLLIAHNGHIGLLNNEVGNLLKSKLHDKYIAIGTDYEEGSFSLWNMKDANKKFIDTLYTPILQTGFANKFSNLPGEFYFIELPKAENDLPGWTTTPQYIASIGMGFNRDFTPVEFRRKVVITDYLDALFIFKKIHPIIRFE